MRLLVRLHPWMLVPLIALAGCGKGGVGAGASADAPACTWHHANPKFCMAPPAGYTPKPEKKAEFGNTQLDIQNADGSGFIILEWGKQNDAALDSIKSSEKSSGVVINEDGKGGFWEDTLKKGGPQGQYHYIFAAVKGAGGYITCMSNGPPAADVPKVLAACRGIHWE